MLLRRTPIRTDIRLDGLPGERAGHRFEDAECEHIVPAEKPGQVAGAIRRLAGA